MIYPYSFTYMTIEGLRVASEQTGKPHSITSSTPITPAALCGAMGLRDWAEVVKKGKAELGHFYIGFYIETSNIYDVASLSNPQVLKLTDSSFILTNNILGWHDTIVHGLSKDTSKETRQVVNYIFAYLRDNGFASLFSKYRRTNLAFDGTIILEEE